jgi:hypothetical protein
MGCSIFRSSARLHFEESDSYHLPAVTDFVYELRDDFPNCFMTPDILAGIRHAIVTNPKSLRAEAFAALASHAEQIFLSNELVSFKPYCGKDKDIFIRCASISFNTMLYLAAVGAVTSRIDYLSVSKHILLSWAMALPAPGSQLEETHPVKYLIATGLAISRFIDRIVETYRILSAMMSNTEIFFVKHWLLAMGATIKRSHEFWIETYQESGPKNDLSWHIFGE